ncbi:MAG: VOC family protein [Dehalococcoidia bacterium]
MIGVDAVSSSVEVGLPPESAFDLFTAQMDRWYVRGPYSWNDPERACGIRLEPWIGGRWIEVWDAATGEGFECGRVKVWEPGQRLVMDVQTVTLSPGSEVEVRFEPSATGTRVTLEHRGLNNLPPDQAAARREGPGYHTMLGWFASAATGDAKQRSDSMQSMWPCLTYDDAPAAIAWLGQAFGFEAKLVVANEDGTVGHAELLLDGAGIMLGSARREVQRKAAGGVGTGEIYVATDRLDAIWASAQAAGATVVTPLEQKDYNNSRGFGVLDLEGNVWSFGDYRP